MRFVTPLQIVIGDARAEVVQVVIADIPGKPLEDFRQLVKRAALQRGGGVVPVFSAFPVNAVKLMLHVKEPDAYGAGDPHDRELNQEISFPSKDRAEG